jgi:hypothetical protein
VASPGPARVTFVFPKPPGPWRSANLSLEDGKIYIRDDEGYVFCVSDHRVRKIGISGILVTFHFASPLPGFGAKFVTVAFGDGEQFFKVATQGVVGMVVRQDIISHARLDDQLSEWQTYLRHLYTGGKDVTASKWFIPTTAIATVLLILGLAELISVW